MSWNDKLAEDGRFFILKELDRQNDGRLNELLLRRVLDMVGIARSREWLGTQLRKLEELGAVEIMQAGDLMVAQITRAGRDHVSARSPIMGVTRPSDAE